jgi:hypothetical protein
MRTSIKKEGGLYNGKENKVPLRQSQERTTQGTMPEEQEKEEIKHGMHVHTSPHYCCLFSRGLD